MGVPWHQQKSQDQKASTERMSPQTKRQGEPLKVVALRKQWPKSIDKIIKYSKTRRKRTETMANQGETPLETRTRETAIPSGKLCKAIAIFTNKPSVIPPPNDIPIPIPSARECAVITPTNRRTFRASAPCSVAMDRFSYFDRK